MADITCPCGARSTISDSPILGDQVQSTNFEPYLETSTGLTVVWICPACERVAKKAIDDLVSVFRWRARHIHFANKMPAPPRTGGAE